jgi:hypothetical protein
MDFETKLKMGKYSFKWLHWSYRPKSPVAYALLMFVIVLFALFSPYLFRKAGISLGHSDSRNGSGLYSTNTKNQWHYQFRYLSGHVYGCFQAKTDRDQLIYSADIQQGKITFELYNTSDSLLTVFSATNEPDTIGNLVEGEKYWVKAIAEKARGRFDMEMKE